MDFVANRTEAGTRLFPGLRAPPSVHTLHRVAVVVSVILSVVFPICLVIVWDRLRKAKAGARQALREISGQILSSIAQCAWNLALLGLDGNWQGCAVVGSIGATIYVCQHFFCYRVLAVRAMAVSNIMPDWYSVLLNLIWYSIYSFIGIAILPMIAFSGKLIYAEEFCIVRPHNLLPIVMAIADGILSLTLIFLFVWPVLQESSRMNRDNSERSSEQANSFRKLVRENLVLSSIPIISTMTLMALISVTTETASYNEGSTKFVPYLELFGGSADELINTICSFIMFRKLLFPSQRKRTKVASGGLLKKCQEGKELIVK